MAKSVVKEGNHDFWHVILLLLLESWQIRAILHHFNQLIILFCVIFKLSFNFNYVVGTILIFLMEKYLTAPLFYRSTCVRSCPSSMKCTSQSHLIAHLLVQYVLIYSSSAYLLASFMCITCFSERIFFIFCILLFLNSLMGRVNCISPLYVL